jgi:heparanase 1
MIRNSAIGYAAIAILASAGIAACRTTELSEASRTAPTVLMPSRMARVGTIDERFQSYNVEMLEVTGGNFWKPYGPELAALIRQPLPAAAPGDTPAGMNPALYQYRPPIDLTNRRLRKLAFALGPAYVRVSGTWANTTYFPESDQAPAAPPAGFMGVLARPQWKRLIDFANAVDAGIVTSFANGAGTRDVAGAWTPEQARRWIEYTRSAGGRIAAAELMNEPTLAAMGGAPAGYDATAYGRDFRRFLAFARQTVPDMLILGPGSVGESTGEWGVAYGDAPVLKTRDLLAASGPGIDAFSYHHYGATSMRCAAMGKQTTAADALSEQWLRRTDETLAFYRRLRDEFAPGKPLWNTETADAACGGNPWAGTFLDTFRYLDQLGRLAKQDVKVVAHNTLVASNYGVLDDKTLEPKPMYWGALLWRKLMGTTVLESGIPVQQGLHVYAHCLRGAPGGVALLVINNDQARPSTFALPVPAQRYTLAAPANLQGMRVQLNGNELKLGDDDTLPDLIGAATPPGNHAFAPTTITFLALPNAENNVCR